MSDARAIHRVPSHIQLTDFVASLLPYHPADVPFIYHAPRGRGYGPEKGTINHVVLSVTPTLGFYEKLQSLAEQSRRRPAAFLHRPFNLDRRLIPRGSIMLASHKRFDELLTVGYNAALADRLQLDIDHHVLVQDSNLPSIINIVRKEFGVCDVYAENGDPSSALHAVAIVNAFNPEMVERVARAATTLGWLPASSLSQMLYLTGEARETGLQAAKEVGMPVACVGHRAAEEWEIRWLASQVRHAFPSIEVFEIFEDEEEFSDTTRQKMQVPVSERKIKTELI